MTSSPAPAPSLQKLTAIATSVLEAEAFAHRQRRHGLRYLKMNKTRCANAGDVSMAQRVIASKDDPGEFENLITFPEVNALFCKGALFYSRGKK